MVHRIRLEPVTDDKITHQITHNRPIFNEKLVLQQLERQIIICLLKKLELDTPLKQV